MKRILSLLLALVLVVSCLPVSAFAEGTEGEGSSFVQDEAAKAAAKREYDAKKGIVEEEQPEKQVMSGIPSRPYCKGRAYDPNRYSCDTTEE